jgi:ABC-type multidrug transport system fused ATPase/permease subunit
VLEGRTCIIVSDRMSLAKLAHKIIVIDKGRIVEKGTHESLLKRHGLYYKLYSASLGRVI